MGKITKYALINALSVCLYIFAVVSLINYLAHGPLQQEPDSILMPILVLMLLVISAATTGFLVFGRPIMWYIDGKKKEALTLLISTIGIIFLVMIVVLSVLVSVY